MSKLEWKLLSIATAKYPPEFPSIVIKYSWCPRTFLFLQTIAKMSKNQGNHKGIRITNQIIQSFCKNQATLVKTSGHAQFDRAVAFHTLAGKINNWGSRLTLQSISTTTLLAKMYKSAFFLLFGNWSLSIHFMNKSNKNRKTISSYSIWHFLLFYKSLQKMRTILKVNFAESHYEFFETTFQILRP